VLSIACVVVTFVLRLEEMSFTTVWVAQSELYDHPMMFFRLGFLSAGFGFPNLCGAQLLRVQTC